MRVHELAKELGITSKELMEMLRAIGVSAKNNFSSVTDAAAEEIRKTMRAAPSKRGFSEVRPPKGSSAKAKSGGETKAAVGSRATGAVGAGATVESADDRRVERSIEGKPKDEVKQGEKPHLLRSDAKRAELATKKEAPMPSRYRSKKGTRGPAVEVTAKKRAEAPRGVHPAAPQVDKQAQKTIEVMQGATVGEFSELIGKSTSEVIKMLMGLGEMKAVNQPISEDAMHVIADELGYEVKLISPEEYGEDEVEEEVFLEPRPPVVTVMGHVDHGKTSILDAIRQTDVISREAGGITQHIGAYQVLHGEKKITFIDTPGHEAFTAMRARGAKVTDIAVLVVAADDGVMPQTVEAINHARAANVPIVVAVNKIDKENANPDRVKQELSEYGLIPEEWGGETVMVEVSAKKKINIDDLLEMILIVAELQELKAARRGHARGVCIESKLDRGRGPVATVLISRGTLRVGDAFVAGLSYGRVRAMSDDKGNAVDEATPAQPVEVVGFSSVPHAGDEFKVVEDERTARQIAEERSLKRRLIEAEKRRHITLEELHRRISEGEVKELNIVIKADVQGSIEAIRDALNKISEKETEVGINVIHSGVGAITETDVMLASASDAIVIGFNVRPDVKAKAMAAHEKVDLRTYRVIYQLVEDISHALAGLLAPELEELEQGRAEVRQIFRSSKLGVIAGCMVTDGEVERNSRVRLVRDGTVIYEGQIASLRRFKEDAKVVKAGFECGLTLEDFQDVKEGDVIEAYRVVERQRQLGE